MSSVWPILHYDDPNTALPLLVDVFGFTESVVVRDDLDDLVHAELDWPGGGRILFGGTKHRDSVHGVMGAGAAATYLVTADVDAVHDRVATASSATVLQPPARTTFGTGEPAYAFTAADHEQNLWTFGSYTGR